MKLPNNFIHFIRINFIVWGFCIFAAVLGFLNHDVARFY